MFVCVCTFICDCMFVCFAGGRRGVGGGEGWGGRREQGEGVLEYPVHLVTRSRISIVVYQYKTRVWA